MCVCVCVCVCQAQTIDILVAEKSSLKSEVDSLHIDLRNKKSQFTLCQLVSVVSVCVTLCVIQER